MASFLYRFFPQDEPEPLEPGIYHWITPDDAPVQYRLHLRIEREGHAILIVNAATVLHLNPSATAHAYHLIQGVTDEEAADAIVARYNVEKEHALQDQRDFREQIVTLATNPDVDPVVYLGMDRTDPFSEPSSAPYRIDIALTYNCDSSGTLDPLAPRRVDRELTTTEWKQSLKALWEVGVPHVTFTGGEPTLREDLRELIEYAEGLGQVTGLLTDGKKLADAAYLDKLAQAGLDHIVVSLDVEDQERQKGLRNALASDVFTAAHLTLTPDNSNKAGAYLEMIKELGVTTVSLTASEKTDRLAAALADTRERAAALGFDLIWDIPAPYSNTNPIRLEVESSMEGAGRAWLYIEPDGDVLPGQGVDRILGNLLREPWGKIWAEAVA
jgi:organic radical activating enzyme